MLLVMPTLAVNSTSSQQQQNAPQENSQGSGNSGENAQKCSEVTSKANQVTEKYNQSQEKYMNAFQNIQENMNSIMLKFKADGYNTGEMETHLNQFSNMIQNASRYYNEFQKGIDNSKNSICGNGTTNAAQEFTRAREQLSACKQEMINLREFVQETLKQDLEDLKAQITQ